MKTIRFIALTIALSFIPLSQTFAQGIPVYDASSFTQMIAQVDAMAKDYQKQLQQLDEAVKQREALTGPRNTGDLLNGILEKQLREYLPNTWKDTMNLITANNLPSGALGTRSIYTNLINTYDPVTGAKAYTLEPTGPQALALDRRTSTTYAAMAASEQAYNNTAERIQIYESLLSELNNTKDLKESTDLQARISAENGLLLSELMRLNAIQMQEKAAIENERLTNIRRANIANQYDAQEAKNSMKLQINNNN